MSGSYAEQYAHRIDAAITRLGWAECTRQQFDPATGEFYDASCLHCELLDLLEGPQQP